MIKLIYIFSIFGVLASCASPTTNESPAAVSSTVTTASLSITPVSHASFVLSDGTITLYNDPVGDVVKWSTYPAADIVLISDIHGDHLDSTLLEAIVKEGTALVIPQAVADKLSPKLVARSTVLANGETKSVKGISIKALPMYNLREEALQYHTKGRGNGYVLTMNNERIYIAGDTEDILEMRALEDIDRAFICMNLPYTMPVDAAADAVIEFAPRIVYPYHFRGTEGLSDTARFRKIVAESEKAIEVVAMDWYKKD